MSGIVEIKSATITEKGQIAIPKDARGGKGFSVGEKVAIIAYDDHIEIRPMSDVGRKLGGKKKK